METNKSLIVIYFLSLALYGAVEIVLLLRFSDRKFRNKDRSYLFIMVPFYLSVYLAPLEYVLLNYRLNAFLIASGFSIFGAGAVLRITALVTLGKNFSVVLKFGDNTRLVVTGIYRYIRHPLYLAVLLISVSGSAIFSCRITWVFILLCLTGILLRIKKEESVLILQYPEYTEYKKRTFTLVPFLF